MRGLRRTATCATLCLMALPAQAQVVTDVPKDHWAYEAVQDLAARGLLKGYPPDGNIFGKRTVTRYEMASLIQRVLAQIDAVVAKKIEIEAPPAVVNPEQLEEIRRLTTEFQTELLVIGSDLKKAKEELAALQLRVDVIGRTADKAATDAAFARKEVGDVKKPLETTSKEVDRLSKEARVHKISGYFQLRFDAFEPGNGSLFTSTGAGGTGPTPTLGAPVVGGPKYGFLLRRVRLRFNGPIAARSDYQLQLDAQNIGQVSLIDAFVNIANLPAKGFTGRFGQFTPWFGYELFSPMPLRESPERAFGFGVNASDYPIFKTSFSSTGGVVTPGSVLPLFLGQNRDIGAAFLWASPGSPKSQTRLSLSVIDGEGRGATGTRNQNRGLDLLGHAETHLLGGNLVAGLSGYYGSLAVRSGPPVGTVPAPFRNAHRMLAGVDMRYTAPTGTTLRAEYIGGQFETTPDREQYLRNNHVAAWYFTVRHPVTKRLEIAAKYDEFYPISQAGKTAGGLDRMDLVRKTIGLGALYSLDEATRLRLWYTKGLTPYDPSAPSGPLRARLGLLTAEVQVSF